MRLDHNGTMRLVIGAIVVVTALTGCSTPAPAPTSPVPTESTSPPSGPGIPPADGGIYPLLPATHPHVQLQCPLISAVHYDPAAIPAATVDGIYVCTAEPWTDAPDGTPQLVQYVDRVAEADIAPLLEAYAVPDAEPSDGACDASLHDPLIVWLHAGEQITPVFAPRDGCGFPSEPADAAYHAVGLHRLLVAREKERT
jgi:hypothetical protein